MDDRVRPSLRSRLFAALAASLPADQLAHPDVQVLLDADAAPPVESEAWRPLVEALGLSSLEHAALWLALEAELDARLATALAFVQGSASRAGPGRPTLGLMGRLAMQLGDGADRASTPDAPVRAIGALLQGRAVASGLLQVGDAQQLAHARSLQLPLALVALLAGGAPPRHGIALGRLDMVPIAPPAWPLPRAWRDASARVAAALKANPSSASIVVLRGADREELCALAAELAEHVGRGAFEVRPADDPLHAAAASLAATAARDGLVPALIAARGVPVWQADAAPGSTVRVPLLAHWAGPLIVLAAADTAFEATLPLHEIELGLPAADDRLALWSALQGRAVDELRDADRAAVAGSRCGISVLAQAASRGGASQGEPVPAQAAIEQAVRASARSLSAWAQVSADRIPADAWVGPPDVQRELGLLLTRCVVRADAGAELGPLLRGRLNPGVKALFIGASGTGKTLAAQWLADRLARPLVRVDLAAVVSKYIGETEKNLAQLLARAEHLDAVLLFDEADSLFGARTDVKQANDRYANMQTNYLLQRLETFHGVALLTSNSKARFDDAFLRRLDAVVEFPLPDVAERRALWSLHLGDAPSLDPALLNVVAALVDLPGGHIRNAVLTAALLACQRAQQAPPGDSAVQASDLREALALEYRKLGQRAPDSL